MAPRVLFALVAAALLLNLAGCSQPSATPEERLDAARERFDSDIENRTSIRAITASMNVDGTEIDAEVVFGRNDVIHAMMSMGAFVTLDAYCDRDGSVVSVAGEVYAMRSEDADCTAAIAGDHARFPLPDRQDAVPDQIKERDDGSLVAHYTTDEDGLTFSVTLTVDDRDRVVRVAVTAPPAAMAMDIEYGAQPRIEVPEPEGRLPASITTETGFADGVYTWTFDHDEEKDLPTTYPLDEFEVHVLDGGTDGMRLATFDLAGPAEQAVAGFTFRFVDEGNGRLSRGDSFTVRHPEWGVPEQYHVRVFDEWAGLGLDQSPLPAAGWIPFAGAAIMLLALLRRR